MYADTLGEALDWRRRFNVISACGSNLSRRLGGKSSATPARMLRKCALKLHMATSAALQQWHPGGTNSNFTLHLSRMCSFIALEILLSMTCFRGTIPARCNRRSKDLYPQMSSASLRFFNRSMRIALLSTSTNIMMHLLPCFDCVGNCPV